MERVTKFIETFLYKELDKNGFIYISDEDLFILDKLSKTLVFVFLSMKDDLAPDEHEACCCNREARVSLELSGPSPLLYRVVWLLAFSPFRSVCR